MDRHPDHAVVGERPALGLRDLLPEGDGPYELVQQPVATVGARRGGREPEAQGRQAVEGALVKARPRQVMGLVEDHEPVAVADLPHVDPGTVVGRDREGPHLAPPVPEHAGVEAQPLADPPLPLVHQVAERRHDQGRDAVARDDGQRDLGLAGAGGLDDDAPAPCALPGRDGRLLIRAQRRQGGLERGASEEALGPIVEGQVVRGCLLPQPRMVERFGAPGPDAVVPSQVWRHTGRPGRVEPERASIEGRGQSSRPVAGRSGRIEAFAWAFRSRS